MQSSVQKILNEFKTFENMNTIEIGQEIGINIDLLSNKLSVATLTNQMFKYFNIDLTNFKKDFNISVKTVRLKENRVPKESMSFEQINFHEVVKENWNNSFLKTKFMHTTFLFVVFEYIGEILYFKGINIWKMPEFIIDEDLKNFWLLLKTRLETGVTLKSVKKGNKSITENNLPSSKESNIMHVRPKAKNASDTIELPDGQFITKQSYWFNNEFVSSILSNMPSLQIPSTKIRESGLNNYDYQKIEKLLSNEIYTITQFIKISKQVFPEFNDFNVNDIQLKIIGYHLAPPFILRNDIERIDDYFNQKILNNRYFINDNDDDVWQSNFVKRKLENMENEYSIIKIDKGMYLTEAALKYASIDKTDIISCRECVEDFVDKDQYFTYQSLKKDNFQHPAEEYGFEQLFYESLLKRPGRIKSVKICGKSFFIKTTSKIHLAHFFKSLLIKEKNTHLALHDLIEVIEDTYNVKMSYEDLDTLLFSNNLDSHYSKKLKILFYNKMDYLKYIQ